MIRTRVNPWINTLKKALTAMLKEGLTSIAFHILPDKFEELFRIQEGNRSELFNDISCDWSNAE